MANCKTCGKAIPDGTEYCNECNALNKADESYLDSLLSSVSQNSSRPIKRKPASVRSTAAPVMPKFLASKAVKAESMKLEKEIEKELEKEFAADSNSENPDGSNDSDGSEASEYDILNSSDDSYLDNLFSDAPDISVPDFDLDPESKVGDIISDFFPEEPEKTDSAEETAAPDIAEEAVIPEIPEETAVPDIPEDTVIPDIPEESIIPDIPEESVPAETAEDALQADSAEETSDEENDFLNELLSSVETNENQPADDPLAALSEAFALAEESEGTDSGESDVQSEDDIFFSAPDAPADVLSDAPADIPDVSDVSVEAPSASSGDSTADLLDELAAAGITDAILPDISDMLDDSDSDTPEASGESKVSIVDEGAASGDDTDILEFWSQLNGDEGGEAKPNVKPDSSEADSEQDELASLLAGLPGVEDDLPKAPIVEAPTISEEQKKLKKKEKKGFFARIFGNVREDLTPEQLEERKQKALEQFEKDEEDAVAAKQRKAEKKAEDAEAAKAKKAEKAEQKKKQAEEKKLQAQKKKEEKDKKEAARRALIEEIEENEGKINKVGASLVFIVFLGVLCFILIGTTIYTYKVSIKQAKSDFERAQKPETEDRPTWYDSAYQDIAGLDVKEEDQRLYDQIMTVSYINTQLLSYIRYSGMNMEAEAIDSLFKGLRRYETYISVARELGISADLDYLRNELLSELSLTYSIDEARAYEILDIPTQPSYTQAINEILEQLN